jgi:hypothetical protein
MSTSNDLGPTPSRKRRRPPVVCTECRRRKAACDRKMPCAQCIQYDLTCVYQSNTSAPRRSAPGLSARLSTSTATNNTYSANPSVFVTASDEAIVNVTSPPNPAIQTIVSPGPISLGFNPDASVEGTLDTVTRPLLEDSLIPPVAAPSRTLRTSDRNEDSSRPHQHTRAWINPDGSLVSFDHSSGGQTNSLNGRYLKSRLFGQSHWMNSCFQVSVPNSNQTSR